VGDWVTLQLLFDGLLSGLTIGLIALGLVLVYRSTRVISFAVGNMGIIGAAVLALLVLSYGWPFWAALAAALLAGTLFGTAVELTVVRRLFTAARVTVLVATIGVAQLALAIVSAMPTVDAGLTASYPVALGGEWQLGDVRVTGPQVTILVVVPLLALGLSLLLNRTTLGRAVTASADNAPLARTVGINPKLASTAVWTVAGLLSTVSIILIAGQSGRATGLVDLGPQTMVQALAAAVIAGMASFRWSLVAGLVLGVAQALIRFNFADQIGLYDLLLFLAVLAAVALRARRDRDDAGTFSFTPRVPAIPEHLKQLWWVRHLDRLALGALLAVAVVVPLIVTAPSRHLLYTTILAFALCGLSLTVLTGWAGQLSLGQMAFAGIGALLTAAFARGLTTEVRIGTLILGLELPAFTFATSVLLAAVVTAGLAALIGVGALRVRGLMLAVSTFAFGVAAAQYLYRRPVLSDGSSASVALPRGTLGPLDLADQRTYYYVVLAVLVAAIGLVARLRRSGVGRTTVAVRDNPDSAAAATVSPTRSKLTAFALSGALASLGGSLLAGAISNVPLTQRFFQVDDSLQLVAIVVIGGLGSVVGPVLGALWVVGIPSFFPQNDVLPLFASSIGLLVLLLYLPGGLVQVPHALRGLVVRAAERRLGEAPAKAPATGAAAAPHEPAERDVDPTGALPLVAHDVVVRFGGNVAVDGASLAVHAGEVVGLIGANGAGKSTLLNAIGGFVPSSGRIELEGQDVSGRSAPGRARLGLGRTFQAARLFPDLTVRETILVALEARKRTGLLSTALLLPPATRAERVRRAEADELLDLVGLGRFADRFVADLSTGTRRILELAGLLALDARVLCLDEPTAGVAQRETEALAPLLLQVRRELGASMVVIEHDLPFLLSVSDRLVCLEAGKVIADGDPDEVRRDPKVVASYLGTDERAIQRSGARSGETDEPDRTPAGTSGRNG
jgi:ABC-type branched-subunit amino acid transport system ATPase component/ABC-type branched-subunit amino acid transport system permease subunit